jgi:hypothetical protein
VRKRALIVDRGHLLVNADFFAGFFRRWDGIGADAGRLAGRRRFR